MYVMAVSDIMMKVLLQSAKMNCEVNDNFPKVNFYNRLTVNNEDKFNFI